jgi:predicted Zn finger-like uncharacterized protein
MAVPACPRCDSKETVKASDSPVKGKFEVYRCTACNYVWRSTEDLTGISKDVETYRKQANRDMVTKK